MPRNRRWFHEYERPDAVLTTQTCFIALLVLIVGAVLGGVGAVVYELLKGAHLL